MEAMRLIVSIVERGQGKKLQRFYQKRQIPLHLQCAGRGTATSEIMDILGLGSSEKDVLVSWAAHSAARALLSQLDSDLRETLKASGIVFSVPLSGLNSLVASLAAYQAESLKKELRGEQQVERTENSVILISCSRGCTDEIMATAKAHGARGGNCGQGPTGRAGGSGTGLRHGASGGTGNSGHCGPHRAPGAHYGGGQRPARSAQQGPVHCVLPAH